MTMESVTVAAVQAAPVLLDRDATLGKVSDLAGQAAAGGARLVAFPEAFIPGYPDWVWRTRPWDANATVLYARLLHQAVVVGSAATDLLAETASRLGGLICWENYMPLARAALYAQGVDIYLAPTWDNSDAWVPTLRLSVDALPRAAVSFGRENGAGPPWPPGEPVLPASQPVFPASQMG
jgi:predicted amidohydrolase